MRRGGVVELQRACRWELPADKGNVVARLARCAGFCRDGARPLVGMWLTNNAMVHVDGGAIFLQGTPRDRGRTRHRDVDRQRDWRSLTISISGVEPAHRRLDRVFAGSIEMLRKSSNFDWHGFERALARSTRTSAVKVLEATS